MTMWKLSKTRALVLWEFLCWLLLVHALHLRRFGLFERRGCRRRKFTRYFVREQNLPDVSFALDKELRFCLVLLFVVLYFNIVAANIDIDDINIC
mmetsp:Transcript_30880/g.37713  ORF Transcript_30880/g.37713 Transcript_30880/m.37713 type:complete len:95 (+) Transcript_30880:474-758(+)